MVYRKVAGIEEKVERLRNNYSQQPALKPCTVFSAATPGVIYGTCCQLLGARHRPDVSLSWQY